MVNCEESTEEKLCISNPQFINKGDYIEVNFDGILRKVIEKEDNYIKISPP